MPVDLLEDARGDVARVLLGVCGHVGEVAGAVDLVQLVDEGGRVGAAVARGEGAHDVAQARGVDREDAALRQGPERAAVKPPRPEHSLRHPLLRRELLLVLHAPHVDHAPADQEEHPGRDGELEQREDDVAPRQRLRGDRCVADVAHAGGVHGVVEAEEGVRIEHRREDLVVDLRAQRVRDESHELHAALRRVPLLLPERVAGVPLHPCGQVARDAVVLQVTAQRRELRGALARDDLQPRHGRRQGADESRGDDEGKDEHADGEDPLQHAPGLLQVLTHEERKDIVEVLGVLPPEALGGALARLRAGLCLALGACADAMPEASDDMDEAQEHDHDADDVAHEHDAFRAESLEDELRELLRPDDLDQAYEPHRPERTQ
mmetsp:Transcript_116826/g.363033  ORF Transcript_116826/g.363033 Transcript_116826/m.363033 type:complete len:377 (+) Transcript_116826:233-1363(+)